jgi:hypothetical protein
VRVQVELGTNAVLSAATPSLAISADGATLALVARPLNVLSPRGLLYVRRLDRLDAQVLAGTEGAAAPFFSPDGEWIAFFADGSLKKIPAIGGAIVSVCRGGLPARRERPRDAGQSDAGGRQHQHDRDRRCGRVAVGEGTARLPAPRQHERGAGAHRLAGSQRRHDAAARDAGALGASAIFA